MAYCFKHITNDLSMKSSLGLKRNGREMDGMLLVLNRTMAHPHSSS